MHLWLDRSTRILRTVRLGLLLAALIGGLVLTSAGVHAATRGSAGAPTSPAEPLAEMLASDGTLNLPPGFRGSLDAQGWRLVSAEGGAPRFVPLKSAESATPLRNAGSAMPLTPGDEKWKGFGATNGVNGPVHALVADESGNIYIGGEFDSVGDLITSNVARWDGTSWSALGNGLLGAVDALVWDSEHDLLYAGGHFDYICGDAECSVPGIRVNHIARWNGTSWSGLGSGVNGVVGALAVDGNGHLYAGGNFSAFCTAIDCSTTVQANHVAKWSPPALPLLHGAWSALGNGTDVGTDSQVNSLAWDDTSNLLYVGGLFKNVAHSSIPASHIAEYSPLGGTWSRLNSGADNGVDGNVFALVFDPITHHLYMGGDFRHWCTNATCTSVGTAVNRIARWHTASPLGWSDVSKGVDSTVFALALSGGILHAGGDFAGWCGDATCNTTVPAARVATWIPAGEIWFALGSGVDARVEALASSAGNVYAGGSFSTAGSVTAIGIAKWTPPLQSWSALASGNGVSKPVYAVAADGNGNVYVGGQFRSVGNVIVNNIARWNASSGTWSSLQNGLSDFAWTMVLGKDGNLYVGGGFVYLCGNADCSILGGQVNHIAKWTPSGSSGTWSGLGFGLGNTVLALTMDPGGTLYAGGYFTSRCKDVACATKDPANHIAQSSGTNWSAVGNGVDYPVIALAADRNNILYAGGSFKHLCGNANCSSPGAQVNSIAQWNGSIWSAVGNGVKSGVDVLAVDKNNNLYVGGEFTHLCADPACNPGTLVNNVAKWNPGAASWSPLGNGVDNSVYALVVDDSNDLFAGGYFRNLCGNADCSSLGAPMNGVGAWNGSSWSALGSGLGLAPESYVAALAWQGGKLSVGGSFSRAGDKLSANFAQYLYGNHLYLPLVKR